MDGSCSIKREEVRDMNLYGEILKKLEGTPCPAFERSFVGEEGNLKQICAVN